MLRTGAAESDDHRIILRCLMDPIQGPDLIHLSMTQDPGRVQPRTEQEHPAQVCLEEITSGRRSPILSPTNTVPMTLGTLVVPK